MVGIIHICSVGTAVALHPYLGAGLSVSTCAQLATFARWVELIFGLLMHLMVNVDPTYDVARSAASGLSRHSITASSCSRVADMF
jgi:hypothetical protein